jgi:hypothetical protein
MDQGGDYYVSPLGCCSYTISIYSPPYNQPPKHVNVGSELTNGIAVDSRTGVFAIAVIYGGGGPGPNYVEFFHRRSGRSEDRATMHTSGLSSGALPRRKGSLRSGQISVVSAFSPLSCATRAAHAKHR